MAPDEKGSKGGEAKLVAALQRKALEVVLKLTPEDVCNTLWALATMKVQLDYH